MYSEYDQDMTSLTKQDFEDYSSKYKDLAFMYQKADNAVEKFSVLDEVYFQFDLLFSDRINLAKEIRHSERRESNNLKKMNFIKLLITSSLLNDYRSFMKLKKLPIQEPSLFKRNRYFESFIQKLLIY